MRLRRMMELAPPGFGFEIDAVSDVGTARDHNEDCCGYLLESAACGVVAVADGVSGFAGGEMASRTAVDATLQAYREQAPILPPGKRLVRAVQRANIDVYELALVVPELHGMATTLTAVALDQGKLTAAHVGDTRLYLLRGGRAIQLTKDHTVAGEQTRLGLLSEERARMHRGRSVLTRSVGRELIVAVDRITLDLQQGDVLLLCSDGLYNVLEDREMKSIVGGADASTACRSLIAAANRRGTVDNVSAAVVRITGDFPPPARPPGLGTRLRRMVGAWRSS